MLNEGAAPAGAPASSARPPPPPPHPRPGSQQQRRQHPPPQHALPSTPVQTVPPHPFHDHPQSTQPSPARTMSREYHPAHQTPFASPPPPSYGAPTPYAAPGRPQPPPLQHLSGSVDMRSPGAGPAPMQSPYTRNTPNSSARAESAAYPFPSPGRPHPDSASPLQQHRYPPSGPYPPRDGFPQQSGPMASPGPVGHPPLGYFPSQQPPVPQTPPVGTPGGSHPYLTQGHQRTASAQSHNSYPSQPFVSPVNTNHHPPPSDQIVRQPSQPPTPHGPPLSAGPRHQSAGPGTFAQPPSPYQPRISTAGGPYPPYPPSQHPQQPPQQQQPSPHVHSRPQPSPHPLLQRAPSVYDQPSAHPHAVDPQRSSLSQSERDRSVSVSPKTRVPSLPSSAGHHSQASLSGPSGHPADFDPRDPRQVPSNPAPMRDAPVKLEREAPPLSSAVRSDRATTPAKRKLDDRDIKPEDLDRQEPRPAPFQANGIHRPGISSRPSAAHRSSSPVLARRRRRHAVPPVWAQSCDRQQLKNPNFLLRKPHVNHAHVNGSAEPPSAAARQERASSRHVSPEASRSNVPAPPVNAEPPVATPIISKPKYLGPWEVTMANQEPFDELCRVVADFLFLHVVNPAELRDLHVDPHCHFEIEAKLGCLVERDRGGARIQLPVQSEVALAVVPNPHYNFSSSMTEVSAREACEFDMIGMYRLTRSHSCNTRISTITSTSWSPRLARKTQNTTRTQPTHACLSTTSTPGRSTAFTTRRT